MVEHSPQILASKEKATKNQAQKVINEGFIYMEYKLNGFRKQVALKLTKRGGISSGTQVLQWYVLSMSDPLANKKWGCIHPSLPVGVSAVTQCPDSPGCCPPLEMAKS